MNGTHLVQGRQVTPQDVARIRELMDTNPGWSRRRLSKALSEEWNWRNGAGQLKDMAARALLVKLQARGLVDLPMCRQKASNRMARRAQPRPNWDNSPIEGKLSDLGPLTIHEISVDATSRVRFAATLAEFHYLGFRGTVGENLQYIITDRQGRLLACLLFGAAAWQCRARDEFIGWTAEQRQRHLHRIANNTRFLILPFVRVPHLASWILGRVTRRLAADWQNKYGHDIVLVETFVERDRFTGTSYRAANWTHVGSTVGRSRQDRYSTLRVPVKDAYVYPLRHGFRRELSS
jgi:hypothetical protein